jgi:hypothetical protein
LPPALAVPVYSSSVPLPCWRTAPLPSTPLAVVVMLAPSCSSVPPL